jgi:hypothetical protein
VSDDPKAVSLFTIATVLGNRTASLRSDVPRDRDEEEGSAEDEDLEDEDLDLDDDSPSLLRLDEEGLELEPDRLLPDGLDDDMV